LGAPLIDEGLDLLDAQCFELDVLIPTPNDLRR
jgi:hypothetical protein